MSRPPKGDNESALLSTQLHVIDNPGNKEHWGDQPIVFPSPADGKSINSFGPRAPPPRTKPGQLERIMTRKTIYSVGSPQNIQLAKMDRVEHPIIGVDNFRPIISFEIKVARYPLRRKANTGFMAQTVNGNGFFLQMRLTTADGQNTADALIVRSMLALLTRQKTGKRLKNKSNCTNLAERRAA